MQMWFKKLLILSFVSIIINDFAFAQQPQAKKDSTILYKNIESYSKGSKFKTFIYGLIFKPVIVISKKKEVKKKVYKKLIQKPYSTFEGKIIRNINIITLDPFGYSVTDTSTVSQSFLYRVGNGMHIKTQLVTIRNLLLIRKNEPFNSFYVKESERLIRVQKYVHDVSFFVTSAGAKSDSVDIFIRELDSWSIIPEGSISTSHIRIDLNDKNIIGTGHVFDNEYSRNLTNGINSYKTYYYIPNFCNTYLNSQLHYAVDGYGNFTRSLIFDRPFYSPWQNGRQAYLLLPRA